jgi:hypothetical protein
MENPASGYAQDSAGRAHFEQFEMLRPTSKPRRLQLDHHTPHVNDWLIPATPRDLEFWKGRHRRCSNPLTGSNFAHGPDWGGEASRQQGDPRRHL